MRSGLPVLLLSFSSAAPAPSVSGHAALVEIQEAIGPATGSYVAKAHRQAVESGASLIVLRLDTPGGLDTAMRDIIKVILGSPIPVVGFVAPGGARAASAGTYILYACHIAAMAPATNLGAATPVPVGGSFPLDDSETKEDSPQAADSPAPGKKNGAESEPGDAMQHKIVNDAVAYIRSLAEKRGRNADWAERAVREGVSLSATDALKHRVVDLIAEDVGDLLEKIDGRAVVTPTGKIVLNSAGLTVEKIEPDWRMQFLSIITSPTVAYILMLIGIYGLLLEGYHPGAIVPGVIGAICLLLALFAFQVLPVNYVGLALILLGVVLMIAETLVPSFGTMGFGGIVAFVFGSIMLMDIDVPGYGVNRGLIFGIALSATLLMALTLYLLWRSRQAPVVTGDRTLIGHRVLVEEAIESEGWAWVAGERWRVRTKLSLKPGDRPRVVAMDGLTLIVESEAKKGD
ncbi:MAG: nodulation protein NfeD [Nevskiales bacterium]|nr:nodulation protein NfeD [Nevskiales bacterium]